jgi:hypothetical protein
MEINIIFHEDDKEKNKDLTDYLDKNLKEIITRGRIYFNFIIATNNDTDKLEHDGITLLPALLPKNSKPVLGLKNIYKFINHCMNNPKANRIKSEEEILQEFMDKEIKNGVSKIKDGNKRKLIVNDDKENDDEFSNDNINRKIQSEQRKRGMNPNNNGSANMNMDELYTPNRPNNLNDNLDGDDDEDNENEDEETNKPMSSKSRNNDSNNEPLNVFNNMQANSGSQDDDMFKSLLEKLNDD